MRIVQGEIHHDDSNDWGTPGELFGALNGRYGPYDVDLACTEANKKCERGVTADQNSLGIEWHKKPWKRGFCNPPYGPRGTLEQWTRHVRAEVLAGLPLLTLLIPHSTAEGWWWPLTEPAGAFIGAQVEHTVLGTCTRYASQHLAVDILPIRGRVRFVRLDGGPSSSAPHHTVAVTLSQPGLLKAFAGPKRGPKPVVTPVLEKAMREFIDSGLSISEATRRTGIARKTWYRHLERQLQPAARAP